MREGKGSNGEESGGEESQKDTNRGCDGNLSFFYDLIGEVDTDAHMSCISTHRIRICGQKYQNMATS